MSVVMLYAFSGRYSGDSEYSWSNPEAGETHRCMLFLRQESDADSFGVAQAEARKYGFVELENLRVGKFQVEALNTDAYRGFAGFYEEALIDGSALVYYPK